MPNRKLLKKEVTLITKNAIGYYSKNIGVLTKYIKEHTAVENHIAEDKTRTYICGLILSNEPILKALVVKYCNLYTECHKGKFVDRFANLSLKWSYHVSMFTRRNMDEGEQSYPEMQLLRKLLRDYDLQDINCTLHSISIHMSEHVQGFIRKCQKPNANDVAESYEPTTDSPSSILAFGGACMRLVYKLSKRQGNKKTMKLITNLKLTSIQRQEYIDLGIIRSTNLKSLHTIPVPTLVPYLRHLNLAIQDVCRESSLALYKSKFVKVSGCIIFIFLANSYVVLFKQWELHIH